MQQRNSSSSAEAGKGAGVAFGPDPGSDPGARLLMWRPAETDPEESRYAAAFSHARDVALDHHRQITAARSAVRAAARMLLAEPAERREMLLHNHPRFAAARCGGWRLAAVLVDEVEAMEGEPLEERLRLAELATGLVPETPVGAAEGATGDGEGDSDPSGLLAADTAARAWRVLGDLQRRRAELAVAGESLTRARRHQRRGSGDPLERAALREASGHLLAARGRRRARALLAGAAKLYAQLVEIDAEGRCRVCLGLEVLGYEDPAFEALGDDPHAPGAVPPARYPSVDPSAEEVREALDELHLGLDLLDPVDEPELFEAGRRRLRQLSAGSALEAGPGLAACAQRPAPSATGCNELA